MLRIPLTLIIFFLSTGLVLADRNGRALKALQEGDLGKAYELLDKSLEKDAYNPGAKYLFARLYSTKSFVGYNVDSAHVYILESIEEFASADEKVIRDMNQLEASANRLREEKQRIDELGYEEAVAAHSIESYEYFMRLYPDAEQFPDALAARNHIAFEKVSKLNTWQAYQDYFETYPNAADAKEAEKRYDRLVFLDKTQGNTVAAFRTFLQSFPNTPYRSRTEKAILEISAADNQAGSYLKFVSDYPNSVWRKRVLQVLYHIPKTKRQEETYQNLLAKTGILDSINTLSGIEKTPLLMIYDQQAYGFIDMEGQQVLSPRYESVPEHYLCGNIVTDYLEVLEQGVQKIISRSAANIFQGQYEYVDDLGGGLLLLDSENKLKVIHKSGFEVLNGDFDDLELVGGSFLKYYQAGKSGLATALGKILTKPIFDDVSVEGDYWILEKNGQLAVTTMDVIAKIADDGQLKLEYKYEEAELMRNDFLFVATGDNEAVFNGNLEEVVPWGRQRIYPMADGWLLRQPFGYRLQNDTDPKDQMQLYDQVLFNDQWLAIKEPGSWSVFPRKATREAITGLDSLSLLSEDFVYTVQDGQRSIESLSGRKVSLGSGDEFTIIGPSGLEQRANGNYLLVKSGNVCSLTNPAGSEIFKARMDDIKYLSHGFFEIVLNGNRGIIDTTGHIPIWPKYEAISSINDSLAMILEKGKFGVFDLNSEKVIASNYETRLLPYNRSYLVAAKNGKVGLISIENGREILDPNFEELAYWSDSTALVSANEEYAIVDIRTGRELFGGMKQFKYVKNNPEEKIISFLGENGFGVLSNTKGQLLAPEYNDIVNLGTEDQVLFFAEQHLSKASFYIVTYVNGSGEVIRSQAFRPNEYEKIYCDR